MSEQGSGLLFIISAPSGTGKTTLLRAVMERVPRLVFSVSYTTRPPRANERQGIDYCFVSPALFEEMAERNEFLEWAEVLGNRYGTARSAVEDVREKGMDVLLDIDPQGARAIQRRIDRTVSIYILPPSLKALEERLVKRGLDPPEMIRRRLAGAKSEMREAHWYHYILVNDEIEQTVDKLRAIITAERCRQAKDIILQEKKREWEEDYGKNHG